MKGGLPGQDMAANVLVGVGLGWLAEKAWPGIHPYGLAGGVVLGTVSGFYQLVKREAIERRKRDAEKKP
jgi:F0F1-type ATP synthase assembly protein I